VHFLRVISTSPASAFWIFSGDRVLRAPTGADKPGTESLFNQSDRSIRDYCERIWKAKPVKVELE
jgi:hypothetical protein